MVNELDADLIATLDIGDYEVAEKLVFDETDPLRALALFHAAMRHLYWSAKDVKGVVVLGRRAIEVGERLADAHPESRDDLLGMVKAIAYDMGSFTWPGWDERGIAIDDVALRAGAEAADLNLRLATELGRGPIPMSSAWWLVGAHRLAAGDLTGASEAFVTAERSAGAEMVSALLARGYTALAHEMAGLESGALFAEAVADLSNLPDQGMGLVEQLQTARRVFER